MEKIELCRYLLDPERGGKINLDIHADTDIKRNALEMIMGYTSLRGAGHIGDARPEQVGMVFKKYYVRILRKAVEETRGK